MQKEILNIAGKMPRKRSLRKITWATAGKLMQYSLSIADHLRNPQKPRHLNIGPKRTSLAQSYLEEENDADQDD